MKRKNSKKLALKNKKLKVEKLIYNVSNDFLILKIFNYLSIDDLINFSLISKKMYNNLVNLGKLYKPTIKYNKKRNIRNIFSINELLLIKYNYDYSKEKKEKYFLQKMNVLHNNNVENIFIEDNLDVKMLNSNLKCLIINNIDDLNQLLTILKCKNLTQLIILSCLNNNVSSIDIPKEISKITYFSMDISFEIDFLLDILSNIVSLEYLTLYCRETEITNYLFNRYFKDNYLKLKSLSIAFDIEESNDNKIKEKSLVEFIKSHQNLEKLLITNCTTITGMLFHSLDSKNLKELIVSNDDDNESLFNTEFRLSNKVPNLTHLTLINFEEITDEFWIDIIDNHKHVKSVTFDCNFEKFKNLFKNSSIRVNDYYDFENIVDEQVSNFTGRI